MTQRTLCAITVSDFTLGMVHRVDDLLERLVPRRGGLISKGMILSSMDGDTAFMVPLFDALRRRDQPGWRPEDRGDKAA